MNRYPVERNPVERNPVERNPKRRYLRIGTREYLLANVLERHPPRELFLP